MRRAALVALSVSALTAAMLAVPTIATAAPADVPSAPFTALGVQASAGSNVGGASDSGGAAEVTGSQVVVKTLTASTASFTSSGGRLVLDLFTPSGTTWQAGQVLAVSQNGASNSAIVRVGNLPNRDCSTVPANSGSVSVVDATYDGSTLTAFGADVQVACGSSNFAAYVRWNSSVGYAGVTLNESVSFGDLELGQYVDKSVTLTATGTDPLSFTGNPAIGGADPDAFSVVGDDCKQQALAAGTSCTVVVRARPLLAGSFTGTLVLVHDSATPWEVPLSVYATDVADGTYQTLAPTRVLDTRKGIGARKGPLGTGGVARLDLSRYLTGPASAVVLNLTVDRPLTAGYLTAYPAGTTRPVVSSINFPAGWQGANLVTVPLGAGNQIDIYNYVGSTSVIADLVGLYAKGDGARGSTGGYHPRQVERLLDTRTWGHGKLPSGYYAIVPVRYQDDQASIAALSVTVTVVRPAKQGYVTAWDGSDNLPATSTLNFNNASGVISNAAIVPVSYGDPDCPGCAEIAVLNQSPGAIDLVVDINGFFDDGNLPADVRYAPLASPTRIVDTRTSLGTTTFGPATTRTVTPPTSVAGYDTIALDANVTAVSPSTGTFVTVWPAFDDVTRPLASILNPNPKQTIADHAIAEVGSGNRVNFYNAAGTTNLLVDLSGTFELFPRTPADQIPHRGGGTTSAGRTAVTGAAAVAGNTAPRGPEPHAR